MNTNYLFLFVCRAACVWLTRWPTDLLLLTALKRNSACRHQIPAASWWLVKVCPAAMKPSRWANLSPPHSQTLFLVLSPWRQFGVLRQNGFKCFWVREDLKFLRLVKLFHCCSSFITHTHTHTPLFDWLIIGFCCLFCSFNHSHVFSKLLIVCFTLCVRACVFVCFGIEHGKR